MTARRPFHPLEGRSNQWHVREIRCLRTRKSGWAHDCCRDCEESECYCASFELDWDEPTIDREAIIWSWLWYCDEV